MKEFQSRSPRSCLGLVRSWLHAAGTRRIEEPAGRPTDWHAAVRGHLDELGEEGARCCNWEGSPIRASVTGAGRVQEEARHTQNRSARTAAAEGSWVLGLEWGGSTAHGEEECSAAEGGRLGEEQEEEEEALCLPESALWRS